MTQAANSIPEVSNARPEGALESVDPKGGPVVFRGLAGEWPLVTQSRASSEDASRYLMGFYNQAPVTAFVSRGNIDGRIFYSDNLSETNFNQIKTELGQVLQKIQASTDDESAPTVYMGSMALNYCLPGLRETNSLKSETVQASVRIWIGNRTRVAAHYDVLENIACVCAGRRRFTLYPPDQVANLYVGPLDFTPAGQPVSLVDGCAPDLDRYPRFAEALKHAQTAVLEPGDGIYIPSMWWHQIEALESFNILINHWWRQAPAYLGAPGDALLHAILAIRELPAEQRAAWQGLFDHYVFNADEDTVRHIPENQRGVLGALDEDAARKIRSLLRNNLNR